MASIIGGGGSGAVGAVCHDGGKFLLSTNRPDDQEKVRKLFTLIKAKDRDQLMQEVYSHAVLNVEKNFSEPLFSSHLSALKAIRGSGNKLTNNLIKQIDYYLTKQNSQQKIKALEKLSLMANTVLTTYEDTLRERVGLRNFLTDLRTPAKHIERVTKYTGEKAELFTSEPQFVAQENTHAEMNIINELFMQGKLLGEQKFFIGDTKKCCASCHMVVTSVNQIQSNKIEMSGTHGTAYIPWQKPEFLLLDEKKLRKALTSRGHQAGQINDLVKLAAGINSTFEANMNSLIEEVQTRSTQPLSERQARSVSPLARSEGIIHQPQEMTQEEREQKNLVNEKLKKAQELNAELSALRSSLNNLQEDEKKRAGLEGNINKEVQSKDKILTTAQSNIDKCLELEKSLRTQQELEKRYKLQFQKTQVVWAESPEGAVQNAATTEINRAEELWTRAGENLLAVKKEVEFIDSKNKEYQQILQKTNQEKEELSLERTNIKKEIANLNTKIEDAREKIKNKSIELTKAKVELKEAEEKLTQIQTISKKEKGIILQPTDLDKTVVEPSKKLGASIQKATTAAISPEREAKKREEVKPQQTFTLVEYPINKKPSNFDPEEPISKKQKLAKGHFLKEDQPIITPIEYPLKQAQKHTTPLQESIVTSKKVDTKKSEKIVKQGPTSTKGEVAQKQAAAIGQEIKPFIAVVAPAQSRDKGKRKIPPQSISKRGKGRSGSREEY